MPLGSFDKAGYLRKALPGKNIFIAGSKKNAGKTTFLNFALKTLACGAAECRPGIMSIGIDGEETDGIFGNAKPRITAEAGNLFVCSENALENGGTEYEIINVYPYKTAIGRPVLAKALRRGEIEISGPENNGQLSEVITDMRAAGADTVFIDGAADRITHSGISALNGGAMGSGGNAASLGSVLVYVARIEPENFNSATDGIKLLAAASQCRVFDEISGKIPVRNILRISGAATERKTERLVREFQSRHGIGCPFVVFDSPSSVFLPWLFWRQLASSCEICFASKPQNLIIVVNLYNVNKADFEKKMGTPGTCIIMHNPFEA